MATVPLGKVIEQLPVSVERCNALLQEGQCALTVTPTNTLAKAYPIDDDGVESDTSVFLHRDTALTLKSVLKQSARLLRVERQQLFEFPMLYASDRFTAEEAHVLAFYEALKNARLASELLDAELSFLIAMEGNADVGSF